MSSQLDFFNGPKDYKAQIQFFIILFSASPGTIESRLYQNQISKDSEKFTPGKSSQLLENFLAAEQGVILMNGLRMPGLVAKNKKEGCKLQVCNSVRW